MQARISFETRTCSDKAATSWLEPLQDACVSSVFGQRGSPRRAITAMLFIARSCNNWLWGPALLAKHHRHTCERTLLFKRALVQTRRQLPGLNHCRMRCCMCVFGVWLAGAGSNGHFRHCFSQLGAANTCSGGPPCWPNTVDTHASAHFF